MRLIDADRLKSYIDCGHLRPPTEVCFSELDVCNMVDKAPTVSPKAVEVVRCKECKHQDHCHETVAHTKKHDECIEYWSEPVEWCSRGERKGGDDE